MGPGVEFGSGDYLWVLSVLLLARASDFFSTWMATPNLALEANPIARKLGWKWGILINLLACLVVSQWFVPAVAFASTSSLVAARNFQSAWLMRSMGEYAYREFIASRLHLAGRGFYLLCLMFQTVLILAIGIALMWSGGEQWLAFSIGLGVVAYAIAVFVYSLVSVWRFR